MRETIIDRTIGKYRITVELVALNTPSHLFRDLYTEQSHEGGITIKLPDGIDNGPARFFRGQYTPAELARDYAKQGRPNPSWEAYDSLQRELAWYATAAEFATVVTIYKNDVELVEHYGLCFEYSWEYSDTSLEGYYREHMAGCYMRDDIHESIEEAREVLAKLAA